jgi:hypothetical protein
VICSGSATCVASVVCVWQGEGHLSASAAKQLPDFFHVIHHFPFSNAAFQSTCNWWLQQKEDVFDNDIFFSPLSFIHAVVSCHLINIFCVDKKNPLKVFIPFYSRLFYSASWFWEGSFVCFWKGMNMECPKEIHPKWRVCKDERNGKAHPRYKTQGNFIPNKPDTHACPTFSFQCCFGLVCVILVFGESRLVCKHN